MSKSKGIFLVAQYSMKPRDHVNTSVKGWMENPDNIRWDEQVSISRGLKSRDMNAQVVLNLSEKCIQRNTFNSGTTFDDIFKYFFENYSTYITQVMAQIDPEYLSTQVEEMQKALDEIPEAEVNNEEVQAQ